MLSLSDGLLPNLHYHTIMKVAVFSIHEFEKDYLQKANVEQHELKMIEARLTSTSAALAQDCEVASLFTSDDASAPVLEVLSQLGVKYLALRTAGFNHVDLKKAKELGIRVARVPAYSPYAIAEHTVALMLALNRKLISLRDAMQGGDTVAVCDCLLYEFPATTKRWASMLAELARRADAMLKDG